MLESANSEIRDLERRIMYITIEKPESHPDLKHDWKLLNVSTKGKITEYERQCKICGKVEYNSFGFIE